MNELLYCARFSCSDPHVVILESSEIKRRRCRDPSKRKKKNRSHEARQEVLPREMIPIVCLATARHGPWVAKNVQYVRLGENFRSQKVHYQKRACCWTWHCTAIGTRIMHIVLHPLHRAVHDARASGTPLCRVNPTTRGHPPH
jgi:hypothetical protein